MRVSRDESSSPDEERGPSSVGISAIPAVPANPKHNPNSCLFHPLVFSFVPLAWLRELRELVVTRPIEFQQQRVVSGPKFSHGETDFVEHAPEFISAPRVVSSLGG
jgi:hypothetical protein